MMPGAGRASEPHLASPCKLKRGRSGFPASAPSLCCKQNCSSLGPRARGSWISDRVCARSVGPGSNSAGSPIYPQIVTAFALHAQSQVAGHRLFGCHHWAGFAIRSLSLPSYTTIWTGSGLRDGYRYPGKLISSAAFGWRRGEASAQPCKFIRA